MALIRQGQFRGEFEVMPVLCVLGSENWPHDGKLGKTFVEKVLSEQADSSTTVFIGDSAIGIEKITLDWCKLNDVVVACFQRSFFQNKKKVNEKIISNSYRFVFFLDKENLYSDEIKEAALRLIPGTIYLPDGKEFFLDPQQVGTKVADFINPIKIHLEYLEIDSGNYRHEKRGSVL